MTKTLPVDGKFTLITLPYAEDALAPIISAETIGYHYGKHLLTYVNNLNALLADSPLANLPLEEIVCKGEGGIKNNAGQLLNHNLYFTQFRAPRENNIPQGQLAAAIDKQFGSLREFMDEFAKKGTTLFGSGWVWLAADAEGTLTITQEANAGNPVTQRLTPLLTFDVWEHAYYLDYQNRRPDHLAALWKIVDWDELERRYTER